MPEPVTKHSIIHACVTAEGGYVNDPDDPGGATRYGVTERVARADGYRGNMRHFPLEDAIRIYADSYWKPLCLDSVLDDAPKAAVLLFNWGVNAGIARSGRAFQRILNGFNYDNRYGAPLAEDGKPGVLTMAMFRAFINHRGRKGADVLASSVFAERVAFYLDLARNPTRRKFAYGWVDRTLKEYQSCI